MKISTKKAMVHRFLARLSDEADFLDRMTDVNEAIWENTELDVREVDNGIGPYEFWGAPGRDVQLGPELEGWDVGHVVEIAVDHYGFTDTAAREIVGSLLDDALKENGRSSADYSLDRYCRAQTIDDVEYGEADVQMNYDVFIKRYPNTPHSFRVVIIVGFELDI